MLNRKMKPITAAVGTAFVASLAGVSYADVQGAAFAANELDAGYDLLARAEEGKCGEGKCGESKDEAKDGEGKCGEGKCGESKDEAKDGEGKCGESKDEAKDGEGKCGEGKCGNAA
jgi:uncharacterized low-complexity protein